MSDCRNGGRDAYERPDDQTLRLRVDFADGTHWERPIALAGREPVGFSAGGVRLVPAPECDWDDQEVTD